MDYKTGLENIKTYLTNEGIVVETVIRWQSGFTHKGTKHGLEVIATIENDGREDIYFVPKYLVREKKIIGEPLRFLKLEEGEHAEY
jgi:hypothetical protein